MVYNATSRRIPEVKTGVLRSGATAALDDKNKKIGKEQTYYNSKVITEFLKDLSKLLSESNFNYKKILLNEFYTLLKNYKVAATTDTTELNDDLVEYIESNVVTSLSNMLELMGSTNDDILQAVKDAFSDLKQTSNNSTLTKQLNQLNEANADIRKSITGVKDKVDDESEEINEEVAGTLEELLDTFNEDYIKEDFVENNKVLLKEIKKLLNSATTQLRKDLSVKCEGNLTKTLDEFDKRTINNAKAQAASIQNKKQAAIKDTQTKLKDPLEGPLLKNIKDEIDKGIVKGLSNRMIRRDGSLAGSGTGRKGPQRIIKKDGAGGLFGRKTADKGKSGSPRSLQRGRRLSTPMPKMGKGFNIGNLFKKAGGLLKNIFKRIGGMFSNLFKKITKLFKPLAKINPVSAIISMIVKIVTNPIFIVLLAIVVAWFKARVSGPIKNFYNKYIKPVFNMIGKLYKEVVENISRAIMFCVNVLTATWDFFKDIFSIGFKPALKLLWETLKNELTFFFTETIFSSVRIYKKIIEPMIIRLEAWGRKYIYNPLVRWYNRYIKLPVLQAWNKIQLALLELKPKIFRSEDHDKKIAEARAKILANEQAQFRADLAYNKNLSEEERKEALDRYNKDLGLKTNEEIDNDLKESIERNAAEVEQLEKDKKNREKVYKENQAEIKAKRAEYKLKAEQEKSLKAAVENKEDTILAQANDGATEVKVNDMASRESLEKIQRAQKENAERQMRAFEQFTQTNRANNNTNNNTTIVNVVNPETSPLQTTFGPTQFGARGY